MHKPVLTIFYQFNPWNSTIGGIQTLIKTFIKYAPSEFDVRLIGCGDKENQSIGRWREAEFAGKVINFLPLFALENDNVRGLIPTTIKYTAALLGRYFASDFMHFHRLEPTLAAMYWQGEKTLFIHNDIQTQMQAAGDKNAILWRRFPAAYFALESLLVRQFDEILSCNTDSVHLYKQRYPSLSSRIAYVKNSFDNEVFYPLQPSEREINRRKLAQKLGLAEDTQFILFAGRLHPQKDPILLVRAFAALNKLDVHLLIAGDGELAPQVREAIHQKGLASRVTMLGALPQGELAQLHPVCSVFVLTSAYEGLPLVALEALACGTPIVTTATGETPRLLNSHSGVVCAERQPECIASALRECLTYPEKFPAQACVQTASPYAASTVMNDVYSNMWQRWELSRGRGTPLVIK
jgi:glycosyltransferase involved in cell wall biosynthesis